MAEFPALPLFTDAYLGDTTHLTTIEHGAYLLLLMTAWRSSDCKLPDDDARLARYARMTKSQWLRIKPTIMEFFKVEGEWVFQSRLTDEAVRVRSVRENQAANGRASALKRKGRHSTKHIDDRQPSDEQSVNQTSTPTPTPTSVDKSTAANAVDPVKFMFDTGIAYLASCGLPESKSRPMLGKWNRDYGPVRVLEAIGAAQRQGIIDPVAWIEGRWKAANDEGGRRYADAPC